MQKWKPDNGASTGPEREELEPDDIVQALNQALLKVFSAPKSLVDERLITNKARYYKTPKRLRGVASNEGSLVSVSYSTIILYNKPLQESMA